MEKINLFCIRSFLNPINFNVVTLSDTKLIETSLENREMHPWGDLRLPIVVIFYYDMPDKKKIESHLMRQVCGKKLSHVLTNFRTDPRGTLEQHKSKP